jgi:hypothetical protein
MAHRCREGRHDTFAAALSDALHDTGDPKAIDGVGPRAATHASAAREQGRLVRCHGTLFAQT